MSQAASYECGSESQRGAGINLIAKLNIQMGNTLVDLGCETGSLAKVLSEKVGPHGKVVAVDPDGERLELAREKHSASNIEYVQGDDRTFPSGQYDFIFCNATIHWISDKEGLFKRAYDNLRPGGQFAFTTPDGPLAIPDIGRRVFDELLGPEFLHRMQNEVKVYLTADEYKSLAVTTGFEQTSVTIENLYPKWRDLDHYIDSMYGWFGGEFVPSQLDGEGLQKLKEEFGDGPVLQREPIRKIEAILTKPL